MFKADGIPHILDRRHTMEGLCFFVIIVGSIFVRNQTALNDGLVTGTDGGNWLAIGQSMLTSNVKAANVSYAPLVPLISTYLSFIFGKLLSLSIIYIVCSISISITIFYIVRRDIGFWAALISSTTQFYVGLNYEIIAWGGYPQIISQCFILLSCYWLSKFVSEFAIKHLYFFSLFAILVSLTWIPGCLILFISGFVIGAINFGNYNILLSKKFRIHIFCNLVVAIFLFAYTYKYYLNSIDLVKTKGWNLHGYGLHEFNVVFETVFREWMIFGSIGVVLLALLLIFTPLWFIRISIPEPLRNTFSGIAISSFLLFLYSQEIRALSLLLIVSWTILTIFLTSKFDGFLVNNGDARIISVFKSYKKVAIHGFVFLLITGQILLGFIKSNETFSYYRVIDRNVVEALDWIKENSSESSLVIAGHNHNSFPYIWWLEGYSETPSYSYSDIRSFNFIDEKEQVRIAKQIMSDLATNSFDFSGIDVSSVYVFLDKFSDQYRYKITSNRMEIIFENDKIVIHLITKDK